MEDVSSGFHESDLNRTFFSQVVAGISPGSELLSWTEHEFDSGTNGIVTMLLGDQSGVDDKRVLGFRCYTLKYTTTNPSVTHQQTVVLKSKATGQKIAEIFRDSYNTLSGDFVKGYNQYYQAMGPLDSEHRDVMALTVDVPALTAIRPRILHHLYVPEREQFVYVMDDFRSEHYTHLDAVDMLWSTKDITDVLHGIASLHARFYGRTHDVPAALAQWLRCSHTLTQRPELQFIWRSMAEEAHKHTPHLVNGELIETLR